MQLDAPNPAVTALVSALNPPQKEAVTAPPEHRLVLAGAGSGKTRVLTHRIAWLIAVENVSPHSVLAVTFTNKAAAEMKARIEQLLAIPVRSLWVGTFHGIAHRMLRLHWKEAHLPQNFQILDADDQQRLVKRVLRSLELPEDKWPPKQVTAFINGQKEEGIRPQALQDQGDFAQRQMVRVYTAYQQQCEANGLVDFAELLLRAHELCRDNADLQAHYRGRFRHILVDEFQDTNTLQYNWLRVLAGDSGVLFAVGDDDQSVYSWRGAKVENMMRLSRDFPGAEVIRPGAELPLHRHHTQGRQRADRPQPRSPGQEPVDRGRRRRAAAPVRGLQRVRRGGVRRHPRQGAPGRALPAFGPGGAVPLQRPVAGAGRSPDPPSPALSYLRRTAFLRSHGNPRCAGLPAADRQSR